MTRKILVDTGPSLVCLDCHAPTDAYGCTVDLAHETMEVYDD